MKRKLWIALAAVLIALAVIAAFIIVPQVEKLARKTVVVGVTYDTALSNNNGGEWKGLNSDLARELFESMGYEVEFLEAAQSDMERLLKEGDIDVCMSAAKTVDTEKFVKSSPYIESLQVLLCLKGSKLRIDAYEELAKYNCAVIENTANVDFLMNYSTEQRILKVKDNAELLSALDSQAAAFAIVDYYYAARLLKGEEGAKYEQGVNAESCPWSFVFLNDETELLSKTNEKLKEYKATHYIYNIRDKYELTQYFY